MFCAHSHSFAVALGALQEWFAASEQWLVPYAAFCFLRDLFGTAEHWRWGVMATPSQQLLQDLTGPDKEWHNSVLCCYWVQYHLHRQLRLVSMTVIVGFCKLQCFIVSNHYMTAKPHQGLALSIMCLLGHIQLQKGPQPSVSVITSCLTGLNE